MTMLSHHLTDETLQDYAAGVLDAPMETLISCHMTLCPSCRDRALLADAIGGHSLTDGAVAAMSGSALDVLALDKAAGPTRPEKRAAAPSGTGVPNPLARLLPSPIHELPWKSFGPGMKQFNIGTKDRKEGAFKLLSLDPGSKMSQHSHGHRELTFIVSGSYSDEMGHFRAGDISDLSADHNHTPHVDSDVACVCLIATDAPVKFDGLFGKIVQPFVGI